MSTIVQKVYGTDGPQIKHLEKIKEEYDFVKSDGDDSHQVPMWHTLSNLLDEFESDLANGLLDSIELVATGEVLSDLVVLAKEKLTENKDVAAVLISAAFEDAAKRLARHNKLWNGGDLSTAINALKGKARIIQGAQVAFADGCLKLRNQALHADWQNIQPLEVQTAISFVETFLMTQFH